MELKATERDINKQRPIALRRQGFIPVELYGKGRENLHLSVNRKDFDRAYKELGETGILTIEIGKEKVQALIYEAVINPLTQQTMHADFYAVRMDEKIQTEIPFEFVGEAPAVREGGILIKSMQEVEVEAFPQDLPREIEIDLSVLKNIGDSIHIGDIKFSSKVRVMAESEAVVATVIEQTEEVETGPASVEDVVVEKEEKKAEKTED